MSQPINSPNNIKNLFDEALSLQQQKNWDGALAKYNELIKQSDQGLVSLENPQLSSIYQNISAVYYYKNDSLLSYIWAKKAVYFNQNNLAAKKTLDQLSKQVSFASIKHESSTLNEVNQLTQNLAPTWFWLTLAAIALLWTVQLVFKKILIKKVNSVRAQNNPTQNSNSITLYSFVLTSLFFIFLTSVSYINSQKIWAYVVVDNSAVQTAPGENKPIIYNAPLGLPIEILKFEEDYYQFKYENVLSGWLAKDSLVVISPSIKQSK